MTIKIIPFYPPSPYFRLISLYSAGLTHCQMFALVNGIGLYARELILGWAYSWKFAAGVSECAKSLKNTFEEFYF